MEKKMMSIFICALIGLFAVQAAVAYEPEWESKQKKMFEQIDVKPGDVVNADNWEKVKDCLPKSVVDWVKKGEFTIFVDALKYDHSPDRAYEELSMKNQGKFAIGDRDQIVEASSGKDIETIFGRPFPVIDMNDPQGGLKIAHNNGLDKMRVGSYKCEFDVQWVSDTKGLDRFLYGDDYFYYIWNRPDGKPIPNPQGVRRFGMTHIKEPYDLAGAAMLYHYWLDGSPERFVQYIPALRRIKKMNTTDRSAPFFGTDFCNDDGGGYVGQPESMKWTIKEKKVILIPIAEWNIDQPTIYNELPGGGWESRSNGKQVYGYNKPDEKYNVAWMPWFVKWVPREVYVLGMFAKDPYYAYGDQELYVDAQTFAIPYKIVWDKSGAYWKTLFVANNPSQWGKTEYGPRLSFSSQVTYVNVDDKTHHASICSANAHGAHGGLYYRTWFDIPSNNPRIYKDEAIATMSK